MKFSVFDQTPNDATKESMFLGQSINLQRYDQSKYPIYNELTEKQKSFFWRPEEVDLSKDRIDFGGLPEHEKHIFLRNLDYQCLVEGTQVLTKRGWVDLTLYNGDEEILIYDINTTTTRWEAPRAKVTKFYSGKVYKFAATKESQFIQIVTPEHRMPHITRISRKRYFVNAKDMDYSNTTLAPISGEIETINNDGLSPLDRLRIAVQADGSVSHRYSGRFSEHIPIFFAFSKERKINRLLEIVKDLGLELEFLRERIHGGNAKNTKSFRLYVPRDWKPHQWKSFRWVDLDGKSYKWCREFVNELVQWDGSIYEGNTAPYYCTTNRSCADVVQAVATLAGLSPRTTIRADDRKDHYKDLYTVRFIESKFKNGESIHKKKLKYEGLVSCVTVSTGAFVIRYRNTVSVSGNCLLDSVQGRSPSLAFLPLISLPELEHWTLWWTAFEGIHSYSYTYIMRNVLVDPSEEFDSIVVNEEIKKRADAISRYYDDLIEYSQYYNLFGEGEFKISKRINDVVYDAFKTITVSKRELMKKLYLCMFVVNVLEAIRFYVSFACSFSFAERKLMEGNAKIIKLIARDEALHLTTTQHIINTLASGAEGEVWKEIAEETKEECINIFREAAQQEKDWAKYLFKDGSMIGLNETILCQYIDYITNHRMKAVGLEPIFPNANSNPIPWINTWLTSDNVQVAPQEVEISSYLVGQVDSALDSGDLADMEL